jgi:acyl phosphate:glycerol-3-phosphate acyltransferase
MEMVFACHPKLVFFMISCAYALGSIPFGLLIAKIAGHGDIRKFGSGNIGATNVMRRSGKFLAFMTFILDAGKGSLAILLTYFICDDYLLMIMVGVVSVLGHVFPIWLDFKGGKGVATSIAVFFSLLPILGILACLYWLVTFFITKISGVAAMITFALVPVTAYFLTYDPRLVLSCAFLSVIVIWRHADNIKKLLAD